MNLLERLSDPRFYELATIVEKKERYEIIVHQELMTIRISRGLSDDWAPMVRVYVKLLGYGHQNDEEILLITSTIAGPQLDRWRAIWIHLTEMAYDYAKKRRDHSIASALALIEKGVQS